MSVQQEVRCATPSQSDPWMRVAGVFLLLLFPGALVILMVRAIFPASLPGGLVVAAWAAVGIFLLISAAKLVTSMVALRSARAEIGRTSEPSDLGVSIVVEGADGRHLRSLRGAIEAIRSVRKSAGRLYQYLLATPGEVATLQSASGEAAHQRLASTAISLVVLRDEMEELLSIHSRDWRRVDAARESVRETARSAYTSICRTHDLIEATYAAYLQSTKDATAGVAPYLKEKAFGQL